MKKKLIEIVNAYGAAEALSREKCAYGLALALVRLKKALREEAAFYLEQERALARKYGQTDDKGHLVMTRPGAFAFRDPGERENYDRERRELGETETEVDISPVKAQPPAEIAPAALEALEGFILFEEWDDSLCGAYPAPRPGDFGGYAPPDPAVTFCADKK